MERIERIHALHRILTAARYPVTVQRLQEELECSRAMRRMVSAGMPQRSFTASGAYCGAR